MNNIYINNKYFDNTVGNIAEKGVDTLFENLFSSHVLESVNASATRSMKDRAIFVLDSILQNIKNILSAIGDWIASLLIEHDSDLVNCIIEEANFPRCYRN
jgi:hypothetical protein